MVASTPRPVDCGDLNSGGFRDLDDPHAGGVDQLAQFDGYAASVADNQDFGQRGGRNDQVRPVSKCLTTLMGRRLIQNDGKQGGTVNADQAGRPSSSYRKSADRAAQGPGVTLRRARATISSMRRSRSSDREIGPTGASFTTGFP